MCVKCGHVDRMQILHTYSNNLIHVMHLLLCLDVYQNPVQHRNGINVWGITYTHPSKKFVSNL